MQDIFEAAADNNLKSVKDFVETKGVNVTAADYAGQTAAHIAANGGHSDIVRYLLDKDPSLIRAKNNWRQTILHIAVRKCSPEFVKYLVDECNAEIYDSNIFPNGGSALHIAAAEGRLDVFKYFIEEKQVSPDLRDSLQQSPAFIAAENKHLPIVQYLVENTTANLTITNEDGSNILYTSARINDLSIPRYLLDGAKIKFDVDWTNRYGETVVHRAAVFNSVDTVKYFIGEKNANLNIRDNEGQTPLHKASEANSLPIIEYLVKNGADPQLPDFSNKTPLMLASSVKTMQYLEEVTGNHRNRRSVHFVAEPTSIPRKWVRITTNEIESNSPTYVGKAHLGDFLMLATTYHRYYSKSARQSAKLPTFMSPQESIRARIDPIAVDAINAYSIY